MDTEIKFDMVKYTNDLLGFIAGDNMIGERTPKSFLKGGEASEIAQADAEYERKCQEQDARDEVIADRVKCLMTDYDAVELALRELTDEVATILVSKKDLADKLTSTLEDYFELQVDREL